ncbi:hypothetical protein MN608_09469 [Microdochium nivale]|nr:hypothetical protein MN608_09469 [Microdochium nivale]
MKSFKSATLAFLTLLPIAANAVAIERTEAKDLAARSGTAGVHNVEKREDDVNCPSVSDMVQWLSENVSTGPTNVFYAADADAGAVTELAGKKGFSDFDKAFGTTYQETYDDACAAEDIDIVDRMSQAFAKSASGGTVYLVLGPLAIDPARYWVASEYDIIKDKRMQIIAVNDVTWEEKTYTPHNNPWEE